MTTRHSDVAEMTRCSVAGTDCSSWARADLGSGTRGSGCPACEELDRLASDVTYDKRLRAQRRLSERQGPEIVSLEAPGIGVEPAAWISCLSTYQHIMICYCSVPLEGIFTETPKVKNDAHAVNGSDLRCGSRG